MSRPFLIGVTLLLSIANPWVAAYASNAANSDQSAATSRNRVHVEGVKFVGNSAFTDVQLRAVVAGDIGKSLTLQGVRSMAATVQAYYHKAGYQLVKVVVPRQKFSANSPVELLVLEGRLGKVQIKGDHHYRASRIGKTLENAGARHGQPLKLGDVRRALTLLNQQAGIQTSVNLKAGDRRGYTNLGVDVDEASLLSARLAVNNYGNKNTGRFRLVPQFTLNDPLGFGDKLEGFGIHTLGAGNSNFGYLSYDIPVNTHGTNIKAYGSGGTLAVGGQFSPLSINGKNWGAGLGLMQKQIFSPRTWLDYHAWFEASSLRQSVLGTQIFDDDVRKVRVGAKFTHQSLRGQTTIGLDVNQGLGHVFGAMRDNAINSSRANADADNNFTTIDLNLSLVHHFASRVAFIGRLRGQYAFQPLVVGQQQYLGGVNSVPGYEESAYSGDSGYTASLESRLRLIKTNNALQLFGRISQGSVYTRSPFIGEPHNRHLAGGSVGLIARPFKGFRLRGSMGVPLGPAHAESHEIFYFQASYGF